MDVGARANSGTGAPEWWAVCRRRRAARRSRRAVSALLGAAASLPLAVAPGAAQAPPVTPILVDRPCRGLCCAWRLESVTSGAVGLFSIPGERDTAWVVPPGTRLRPDTAIVRVRSVGAVLVDEDRPVAEDHTIPAGDTLHLIHDIGEGWWDAWHDGRPLLVRSFWDRDVGVADPDPRGRMIRPVRGEWWVRVRAGSRTGWVHAGDEPGTVRCGADPNGSG